MKERMLLTLLFACVLIVFLFGSPTKAQAATTGSCGENLTWTLDDEGTLTISGTGPMYDYDYKGYSPWHETRDSIKKAIVEKGVTSIGANAFFSCSALTGVEIADTVKFIGESAFSASGITDITLPEGITQICTRLFFECHSLTSIKIPESVTVINNRAFWECTALSNITFPNGLIRIDEYAFGNCTGLTDITIPKANAYSNRVFSGCTNITKVSFAKGVTYIGDEILEGCTGLTSITIPEGVTTIGSGAFEGCAGLKDVTIPSSVTVIKDRAFRNTGLTDITIPVNVKKIGNNAFENCTGLISFTAEGTVETIDDRAFEGCSSLAYVTLPDSVTTIGFRAFYGCAALKSIVLPGALTEIDEAAFSHCAGLTNIIIPDSVETVEKNAFAHCTSLTSVVFGDSVVTIGNSAFNNCKNLSVLTMPKSLVHINEKAFNNCSPSCNVNYKGSKDEWQYLANRGLKQEGNSVLTNATFLYDYTGCEHACDAGKMVTKATCKVPGTRIIVCMLCKELYTVQNTEGIIHSYDDCGDAWCNECSYQRTPKACVWDTRAVDKDNHCMECLNCGWKLVYSAHTPGPEATETTPQTCTDCGYVIKSVPNHSHEYISEIIYDSLSHWYACKGCNEKKDAEKHQYANACSTVCIVCGFTRTITSYDAHTYSTKWSVDGVYHWHECTACHDVKDGAAHTPGPEATETTPQTCVTCGYVITPTQNHTHEFSDTLTFDGANHWYACSGCNEKKDLTVHSFGDTWVTDDNCHRRVCTCGEKIDEAAHTWDGNTCSGCGILNPTASTEPNAPSGGKKNDATIIIVACVVGVAAIGGGAAAFILKKKK